MAKRGDEWFPLSQAVVAYDHAGHAPLGDVITLDCGSARQGCGAQPRSGRVTREMRQPRAAARG
jgi:hypothetical protein